jgi:hypothetical protein
VRAAGCEESTRDRVPLQWAITQHNPGIASRPRSGRTGERRYLDAALEAVDGALEKYRKARADFYIEKGERSRTRSSRQRAGPRSPERLARTPISVPVNTAFTVIGQHAPGRFVPP